MYIAKAYGIEFVGRSKENVIDLILDYEIDNDVYPVIILEDLEIANVD